jgi:hypothetical protein
VKTCFEIARVESGLEIVPSTDVLVCRVMDSFWLED